MKFKMKFKKNFSSCLFCNVLASDLILCPPVLKDFINYLGEFYFYLKYIVIEQFTK